MLRQGEKNSGIDAPLLPPLPGSLPALPADTAAAGTGDKAPRLSTVEELSPTGRQDGQSPRMPLPSIPRAAHSISLSASASPLRPRHQISPLRATATETGEQPERPGPMSPAATPATTATVTADTAGASEDAPSAGMNLRRRVDLLARLKRSISRVASSVRSTKSSVEDEHNKQASKRREKKRVNENMEKYLANIYQIYSYAQTRKQGKLPWGVISPGAKWRVVWEIVLAVLVLYYVFEVPFRVAFESVGWSPGGMNAAWAFDILADTFFIADIVLTFNLAFHEYGDVVAARYLIARRYAYTWLVFDVVASVPLSWFGDVNVMSSNIAASDVRALLRAARLLKVVLRLFKLSYKARRRILKFNSSVPRFLHGFSIMIILWHFIACSYWMVAVFEYEGVELCAAEGRLMRLAKEGVTDSSRARQKWCFVQDCVWYGDCLPPGVNVTASQIVHYGSPDSWVPHPILADSLPGEQYTQSLFWALEVTTGIGDDIIPNTDAELSFTIFMTFVGLFMYSFFIGSASSLAQNMDAETAQLRTRMDMINSRFRRQNVPATFHRAIVAYYHHKHATPSQESAILGDLPMSLRLRLVLVLNRDIFERIPIFAKFSAQRFVDVLGHLSTGTYLPGEFITRPYEPLECIYFIKIGKVDFVDSKDELVFNAECVLDPRPGHDGCTSYAARAVDYCDLVILTYASLVELGNEDDNAASGYTQFVDALKEQAMKQMALLGSNPGRRVKSGVLDRGMIKA